MTRTIELLEVSPSLMDRTFRDLDKGPRHGIIERAARAAWQLVRNSGLDGDVGFSYRADEDCGRVSVRVGPMWVRYGFPARWTEEMAAASHEGLIVRVAGLVELEARLSVFK